MMKTVVQKVTERKVNGQTFYSFKGQDGEYYGTGKIRPPAEGSYVQFEASKNARGYWEASELVILPPQVVKVEKLSSAAVSAAKNAGVSKDEYWTNREARDVEVQKRIELQSCRNSAIALVSVLLQHQAVPVPKPKAEQEEFVRNMVDKYTTYYQGRNENPPKTEAAPELVVTEDRPAAAESTDDGSAWS